MHDPQSRVDHVFVTNEWKPFETSVNTETIKQASSNLVPNTFFLGRGDAGKKRSLQQILYV